MVSLRLHEMGLRQRVAGASACYGALLALAASEFVAAAAMLAVGAGMLFVDRRRAPLAEEVSLPVGPPRWPLALTVLLAVPLASNLLVIPLVVAGGSALSDLPLEAAASVTGLAAAGAGGAAVRYAAPPATHGWWALAGAGLAVTLFGALVAVFSS